MSVATAHAETAPTHRHRPAALLSVVVLAIATAGCMSAEARTFLDRTNALRSSQGIAPLEEHDVLTKKAEDWARHMASTGRLEHSNVTAGLGGLRWTELGSFVSVNSSAATLTTIAEVETFTLPIGASIIGDSNASAARAVLMTRNGTANGSINVSAPVTDVSVRARATVCDGGGTLTLKIDGTQRLTKTITNTSWNTFIVSTPLVAGNHAISVTFTGDYYQPGRCDRNLFLDKVGFAQQVPPPSPVYGIPATIASKPVCDATMPDVSQAIYDWIKTVPNGATAQLAANQCYRTESELPIYQKSNWTLDGNGSKLQAFTDGCDSQDPNPSANNNPFDYCKYKQMKPACHPAGIDCVRPGWPQSRRRIDIYESKNIVIKNIKLDGGHPNPGANGTYDSDFAFQHGISFNNDNDTVTVENIQIDRVWGDFIYIGGTGERNITIQNNKFGEMAGSTKHGNGRQGIALVNGQNIVIKNNRIFQVRRTVLDIEPHTAKEDIRDIYFDNNTIGDHGLNLFSNLNYNDDNAPVIENLYFRNNVHLASRFGIDSRPRGAAYASVNPADPATYKRRNYQFINNSTTGSDASGTCATGNQRSYFGFSAVDGLVIQGTKGQVNADRCMHLAKLDKVRNARIIDNEILNAKATIVDYYLSPGGCERNNKVGNPLTLEVIRAGISTC